MTDSPQTEIEKILKEDNTTRRLISSIAKKNKVTVDEGTKDLSKLFAQYRRFLIAKEQLSPTVESEDAETCGSVSHFLNKYSLNLDMVDSIIDTMRTGLTYSADIPSIAYEPYHDEEDGRKQEEGKRFKLFLISATAVLMVMNIARKPKDKVE